MLSVKVRQTADTFIKVFGMTQLRIKPSLPWSAVKIHALMFILKKIVCR